MEEEPDVPVVFLHTLNRKTEGHGNGLWLFCGQGLVFVFDTYIAVLLLSQTGRTSLTML